MTVEFHFTGRWLSGSAWPFGKHFRTFIVLHLFLWIAPPPTQVLKYHIRNYVLMFYFHVNKYVA